MSNVPSGKLVLLNTLNMCKAGDSVRIVGMYVTFFLFEFVMYILNSLNYSWKGYDTEKELGLLCYKECNAEVSLALIASELPREGDTVQCIGEIMEEVKQWRNRSH
jgi:hypothetical protein